MSFMSLGTLLERETNVTPRKSSSKLLAIRASQLICLIVLTGMPVGSFAGAELAPPTNTAQQPSQQPRGTSGAAADDVNATGAAVKAFMDRVKEYTALQKKAENGLPKLTGDDNPSKIEANQAAVAARIKLARPGAKPGELFGDAAPMFKAIIRKDAKFRTARDSRAAMEEVPKYDPPKVNAPYPEKAPLATVPPLLLDQFPRLPEGLEYRFMGNDLILRDVKANLIADFINEAIAPISKK
jgi:hypothetical protein